MEAWGIGTDPPFLEFMPHLELDPKDFVLACCTMTSLDSGTDVQDKYLQNWATWLCQTLRFMGRPDVAEKEAAKQPCSH